MTDPSKAQKALNAVHKGRYEKAKKLLKESLEKDTLNPSVHYVYAILYSEQSFKDYYLDTAYRFLQRAISQWSMLSEEQLRAQRKKDFRYKLFEELRRRIDSLSFLEAQQIATLEAYDRFITLHSEALDLPLAVTLRDSIAFASLSEATHSSHYKRFMIKHPRAQQYAEARARYEALRFEELYILPHLKQFKDFLEEFPLSSLRDSVTFSLLQMMSLNAHPISFIEFIESYPSSADRRLAIQLLSSIDKALYEHTYWPRYASLLPELTDSLHQAATDPSLLLPVGSDGAYSFIDLSGTPLPTTYDQLIESYFCNGLSTRYLLSSKSDSSAVYTRSGAQILRANVVDVEPLSPDFLRITLKTGQGLWHLSAGQLIPPRYEAIWPLSSGLFVVQRRGKLGLSSILHALLLEPSYDSIEEQGPFLILKANDKIYVGLSEEIIRAHQQGEELPLLGFDQVEVADSSYLLARSGKKQELLDASLRVLHSVADYQIESLENHLLLSKDEQLLRLFSKKTKQLSPLLSSLDTNLSWIAIKDEEGFGLLPQGSFHAELRTDLLRWGTFMGDSILRGFDSLYLVGDYLAVGCLKSEQLLYFPREMSITFPRSALIYELSTPNTRNAELHYAFYRILDDQEVRILNHRGEIISTQPYTYTPISKDYLIVEKSAKEKGIISTEGILEVPLIHKAISYPNEEGLIPLLHNKQLGLFDTKMGTYLPAQYQSVPTSFGPIGWKVRNRNKTGVISPQRKAIVPMLYQDLEYCGPNYYIASRKHGFFVHYYDKKEQKGPFSAYKCISPQNGYTLLQKDAKWGLIDKQAQWLISPNYDQIVAIGTEEPIAFLANRYIEDADIYLSVYFSKEGVRIFSETHKAPPPYLFCNE